MNEKNLIEYYNKFNEDKRLNSRHGQIEYITSMKYIHEYLQTMENPKILDIGAGTGKYSIALAEEGYDVTAVELVKHNLRVIEKKSKKVKAFQGNAINLSPFSDSSFDFILLFGPMYHLCTKKEQLQALEEAKRLVKRGGIIMVAYIMNEYAVLVHGFRDNFILESIQTKQIDHKFHCTPSEDDLYHYMRIEDINELNALSNLQRKKIITPDGPANYMRHTLNQMDDTVFQTFIDYHLSTCERMDMMGAAAHTVDILKKIDE